MTERVIQSDLAELEKTYGMSSEDFFQRWQAGETDDRMGLVEWASCTIDTYSLPQAVSGVWPVAQCNRMDIVPPVIFGVAGFYPLPKLLRCDWLQKK